MFQSRNRETFDSNLNIRAIGELTPCGFQSRNRETFDSNKECVVMPGKNAPVSIS